MKKSLGFLALVSMIALLPGMALADFLQVSQTSVSISAGSSASVTTYPPNNLTVNITSITNVNVAYGLINNNILTIYGLSAGTSQITVCTYAQHCATINATVSGGSGGGSGQVSFSQSNITLNTGQNLTVTVYNNTSGSIYVSSVSPSNVVSANLSGNNLTVYANNSGSASVVVCSSTGTCGTLNVTVNQVNNQVSLSQTNVALSSGQNVAITIFGGYSSYYVSNNSNSNAVSTSISGNTLWLFAQNQGTSSVTVCASSVNQCATVFMNVTGSTSNPYFLVTSLNNAQVNNYYSAQLSASGGNPPYTFLLSSGTLPSGLFLNSNGFIGGTPTTSGNYNFTIRLTDNAGRAVFQNFNLNVTGGSVLGTSIYKNGTLVNDQGTVWIIYKNTKSGFANYQAFSDLGYKISNVIGGSTASVNNSGFVITHSNQAHPWGTWIKSGSTVYFVHEAGLIPIPTYDIFLNNGGEDKNVVFGNSFDFNKSQQSLMTYSDSRLR
ncbi:MAG: putative Ig domain-containing protein [Candidatus Doudnabacteria bacterium]|nr:putative Ig domain-containing protein [Candidatus Doudnabacteria bacterium]